MMAKRCFPEYFLVATPRGHMQTTENGGVFKCLIMKPASTSLQMSVSTSSVSVAESEFLHM